MFTSFDMYHPMPTAQQKADNRKRGLTQTISNPNLDPILDPKHVRKSKIFCDIS